MFSLSKRVNKIIFLWYIPDPEHQAWHWHEACGFGDWPHLPAHDDDDDEVDGIGGDPALGLNNLEF